MNNFEEYQYLDISVNDPQLRNDINGDYTVYRIHFEVCFYINKKFIFLLFKKY